jgi:hypothetical protein
MNTHHEDQKQNIIVGYTEFVSYSPLTKAFAYVDGKIEKTPSAQMITGTATRKLTTFREYADRVMAADCKTAMGYGQYSSDYPDSVNIVVAKQTRPSDNYIARTREFFSFQSGPGIFMGDHDPSPFGPVLTPDELLSILIDIHPDIANAAIFIRGSVSAGVHKKGEHPLPNSGHHLYIAVADAADISRYGHALVEKLWLRGYGFIALSKRGDALVRTVIDSAVFSPERLDFVGKPIIQGNQLTYAAPESKLIEGCLLDTSTLPSLTLEEKSQFQALVEAAKAKIKKKAGKLKNDWKAKTVAELVERGASEKEAKKTADKICSGSGQNLYDEFPLEFTSAGIVTINQVLANPNDYDEQTLADPVEGREYGRMTAKFYWNDGSPVINSMAHGGCVYFLKGKKKQEAGKLGENFEVEDHDDVFLPQASENPVLVALRGRDLYIKSLSDGRHEMVCPWAHEHNPPISDSNHAIFYEPRNGRLLGGFKCECCKKNISDLLTLLNIQRRDAKHKPIIRSIGGGLHEIIDKSEQLVAETGQYFQQGGLIVRVTTNPNQSAEIKPLNKATIQRLLTSIAVWMKFDKRSNKWYEVDCPVNYAHILHDSIEFRHIPALLALARQPAFRADGSLSVRPGYDPLSFIYGVYDEHEFSIPANPSREDAERALLLLRCLLAEVAFKSAHDEAAALATILNAAVRPSLPAAPGTLVTTHSPGGGKSFLLDIFSAFATPGDVSAATFSNDDAEMSKQIIATLMEGVAVIKFDEMKSDLLPIKTLLSMLTASSIEGRILGVSKIARPSTRALVLFAGNNVSVVADTSRRVLTVELDPQIERPESREFINNPLWEIRQNRGLYVSAALTIIKAWVDSGKPKAEIKPLNGYEMWSDYCRQPLLWLGMADPCARMFEAMDNDPDRVTLGWLQEAWYGVFKSDAKMIREVRSYLNTYKCDDLLEVITEIAGGRDGIDNKRLGWWIKKHAGRIVNGWRFEKDTTFKSNSERWKVVKILS